MSIVFIIVNRSIILISVQGSVNCILKQNFTKHIKEYCKGFVKYNLNNLPNYLLLII